MRRILADDLPASRVAVVGGVAFGSAVIILLIRFVSTQAHEWRFGDAGVAFVEVFATSAIIVGLLNWHERRRWKRADRKALSSLALAAHLAASGWSNPMNLGRPDLASAVLIENLEKSSSRLSGWSAKFDEIHKEASERATAEVDSALKVLFLASDLKLYWAEGSRRRRLEYLNQIVQVHLPTLIDRRNDAELAAHGAELRDFVVSAFASADQADAIIHERIFHGEAPGLAGYRSDENLRFREPVLLLAGGLEAVQKELMSTMAFEGNAVGFAIRCVGALRNELQWVAAALDCLARIIADLGDEIDESASEIGRTAPLGDRTWAPGDVA